MRSVRMILGLVVVVCAFGALTAPAFAKVKEPKEFGKFVASTSGSTKGIGEASEMTIGPYKFPNGCEQELKSKGNVVAGESESFFQEVKFKDCVAKRKLGGGIEEPVAVSFTLGMEFHSAGFVETGGGGSVEISKSTIKFKGKKSYCEVKIPSQRIPGAAEKNPEKEFEAFSYSTEKEKQTTKGGIKKFGEFRERLDIEWEYKGMEATVPITSTCEYKNGEEGGKFNPETNEVDFGNGKGEGELEEITLKAGNLKFVPAP